ncbi:MAG TPA: methylcrotonoyl-CoA carboxylase, partial [Bacteroidetes bacterium]|nr:methylcrotonoyl-CoA carboxylase [Bacteroidota bacterium]
MPINESDKNKDAMKMLLSDLHAHQKEARLGGGEKRLQRHKAKGKMTARERIDALLDDSKTALEIGTLAGKDMYPEYGGCPSGGVVVKIGHVQNTLCVIVANDATVKAGAWFPITGKKNLRAQEIAMENHIPIIYLVDSAGVFLPMQDEIFP